MKALRKSMKTLKMIILGLALIAIPASAQTKSNSAKPKIPIKKAAPINAEGAVQFRAKVSHVELLVGLIDDYWEGDWSKRVSYAVDTSKIKFPELRVVATSPEQVFKLYNRIAERSPEWGEWVWEGELHQADSITLVPKAGVSSSGSPAGPTKLSQPSMEQSQPAKSKSALPEVRAFSVAGLKKQDVLAIVDTIHEATEELRSRLRGTEASLRLQPARLSYHPRTNIVLAHGTPESLKIAQEILTAAAESIRAQNQTPTPASKVTSGR